MVGFLSKLFGSGDKVDFRALIEGGAILLDVRTVDEYRQGAAPGSVNIPLDGLASALNKFEKEQPIVTVCASGMRSGSAARFLKEQGFEQVYNGGCWYNYK